MFFRSSADIDELLSLFNTHAMESPEHREIAAKGIALANERALIYRGKVRQMMALFDEINKLPGSLREKSMIAEAHREYKETTGVFDDFVDIDGILPVPYEPPFIAQALGVNTQFCPALCRKR